MATVTVRGDFEFKGEKIIGIHKEMNKDSQKGRKKSESHPSNQNKRKLFFLKKQLYISAEMAVKAFLDSQFTL